MPKPSRSALGKSFVPLLVGAALVGAFYAGQYVGSYDEHKKHELIEKRAEPFQGVDQLRRLGPLVQMLQAGRVSDVDRVLKLYVSSLAPSVKGCAADPVCRYLEMGSKEQEAELRGYLDAAGAKQ
jgi:hypothetical protein